MSRPTTGHVKISRKAYADDPWWNERRAFSKWEAWEDVIQMAAFRPCRRVIASGDVVTLARGEFVASLRFLAERWNWSVKQVRGFVAIAARMSRFRAQRETPLGTVYAIVNYDTYQSEGTTTGTEKGTAGAQAGHSKGTKEKQLSRKAEDQNPAPADAVGGSNGNGGRPQDPPPPPPSDPEPSSARYPHFPKASCDRLHVAWVAHKGGVPYGRFRKAFGESGLFPATGPQFPDEALEAAIVAAVEITGEEGGYAARSLTPETFVGNVVEWVRLGGQTLVDEWGEPTERGVRAGVTT